MVVVEYAQQGKCYCIASKNLLIASDLVPLWSDFAFDLCLKHYLCNTT